MPKTKQEIQGGEIVSAKIAKTLSASRLKTFLSCSWIHYCEYTLKLPSTTHPKTKLGTLAHLIFELLSYEKHRKHYDLIMNGPKKSIYNSPAIARLVSIYLKKNPDITTAISQDLDSLVLVGLSHDFFPAGAEKVLPPEHKFLLELEGMKLKGFIDQLIFYKDRIKIRDYKSQGKRFTQEEMDNNIQAALYQLYCHLTYKLPAEVEFIMLRHPETKRSPGKHLQVVPPYSEDQLNGFIEYLKYLNEQIHEETEETAKQNLKVHTDDGFCKRVCSHKEPRDYYILLDKDGQIVKSSMSPYELKAEADQKIEKKSYMGCPFFYNEQGKPRNFEMR